MPHSYHRLKPYYQQNRRKRKFKGRNGMEELKWKGKTVGYYYGKSFLTYRNDFQIMQKFKSFGISVEVLEILKKMDIRTIIFKYQGVLGKIKFVTDLNTFLESKNEYTDEGNDVQKHVPLDYMTRVED